MYPGYAAILAISLSCTVFFIHTAIAFFIGDLSSSTRWVQILVTTFASASVISFVTKIMSSAFSNIPVLFKLVMGKYYLRGTWVGIILTESGNRKLFVEHYDQTTMGLVIKGWAFIDANSKYGARWTTQCVVINPEKKEMSCLYETHVINVDGRENDVRFGTGRFTFVAVEDNGAAKRMEGIAVDEYHSGHIRYETVERISPKLLDVEYARKLAFEKFGSALNESPRGLGGE